jgi:hypothetical protein
MTDYAKETGQTVNLYGHSGGGLQNYLTILNSNPDQFKDESGRSVLNVTFNGAPANTELLQYFTEKSGANFIGHNINANDPVANVLGFNNGGVGVVGGAAHTIHLFNLFGLDSPHSNYTCQHYNCNGQTIKLNIKNTLNKIEENNKLLNDIF